MLKIASRLLFVGAVLIGLAACGPAAHYEGGPHTGDSAGTALPKPQQLPDGNWLASCWVGGVSGGYFKKMEFRDEPVTPPPCPGGFDYVPPAYYGPPSFVFGYAPMPPAYSSPYIVPAYPYGSPHGSVSWGIRTKHFFLGGSSWR